MSVAVAAQPSRRRVKSRRRNAHKKYLKESLDVKAQLEQSDGLTEADKAELAEKVEQLQKKARVVQESLKTRRQDTAQTDQGSARDGGKRHRRQSRNKQKADQPAPLTTDESNTQEGQGSGNQQESTEKNEDATKADEVPDSVAASQDQTLEA